MAKQPKISHAAANMAANARWALANGGTLRLYAAPKPASANTPLAGQTLIATLNLANPAFQPAVNGVVTSNPIGVGIAVASATAAWYRIFSADGLTVVCDGTVGLADADLILDRVAIDINAVVTVNGLTFRENEG